MVICYCFWCGRNMVRKPEAVKRHKSAQTFFCCVAHRDRFDRWMYRNGISMRVEVLKR